MNLKFQVQNFLFNIRHNIASKNSFHDINTIAIIEIRLRLNFSMLCLDIVGGMNCGKPEKSFLAARPLKGGGVKIQSIS